MYNILFHYLQESHWIEGMDIPEQLWHFQLAVGHLGLEKIKKTPHTKAYH